MAVDLPEFIGVRTSTEMKQDLAELAEHRETSAGAVIRVLIKKGLKAAMERMKQEQAAEE